MSLTPARSEEYAIASRDIPPKIPNGAHTTDGRYEARKAVHVSIYSIKLGAPAGFDLDEWPYMHLFHAWVMNGEIYAFANPAWLQFAEQFLFTLPVSGRWSPHSPPPLLSKAPGSDLSLSQRATLSYSARSPRRAAGRWATSPSSSWS